ncbi:MAG: RNA polymerase sigma factor [Saprospiraceae bacterium]
MLVPELIQKCIKKDPSAQRELVGLFAPMMLSISRRYVQDDGLAYDVLQESWINIFQHIETFNAALGSFEGWISRIVVNQSLKELRRRKGKYISEINQVADQYVDEPEVYAQLETETMFRLILQLPDGCREIFNLYVMEQYAHKEIAALLNISEGTSRSQLSRARNLLRNKIEQITYSKARAV